MGRTTDAGSCRDAGWTWQVRCRTIAIMQLLGFYKQAPLFDTFMAVRAGRV
jgi:hypothetical protein